MKAVIIEDEKLAAQKLKAMLSKVEPSLEIVAEIGSIEEAIAFFQQDQDVELVFLDIHLSDGSSFNIFDQAQVKVPIIFTTAYDEYALKAFKVNSIDYLLKPIAENDLKVALDKLKLVTKKEGDNNLEKLLSAFKENRPAYKHRFLVSYGSQIKSIKVEETAYFYADNKMVFLVSNTGHKYVADETLDHLEQALNPMDYFRVNRTFIIGINSIKQMHTYSRSRVKIDLLPDCDKECIVSTEKCNEFKEWLGK